MIREGKDSRVHEISLLGVEGKRWINICSRLECASRVIWAENCKCTPSWMWQQRRCSIGGGWREGEYGGGERWSEHPCLISWPLCPRDTSHLKFKRVPSGRIKTEARWLNWNLSSPWKFEIKAAANWTDSETREISGIFGRKSSGRSWLIFHGIVRG